MTTTAHPQWRRIVGAILFAQMLTLSAFTVTIPVLPLILKDFFSLTGNDLNRWTGYLSAGSSFAMMILMPVWGILADRFGRRLMLLRALASGVLIIGLMMMAQTPWQLLILQTLQGGFTGSIAAATVLILYYTPKEHTVGALSLLQVSIFLGKSIGPLLGGTVYDAWGGRANFPITMLILVVALLSILLLVPKDKPTPQQKSAQETTSKAKFQPYLASLMSITLLVAIALSTINASVILYIQQILSKSPALLSSIGSINGWVVASTSFAMAMGALVFGRLSKYIRIDKLLFLTIIGTALSYLPQIFVQEWQQLLGVRLLEGFFVGGITPNLQYFISRHTATHQQGLVFGLNRSLDGLGLTLGPLIGTTLLNIYNNNFLITYIVAATILLISALLFSFISVAESKNINRRRAQLE